MLEQLIQECLAGNRKSQSALYSLFADRMFGLCLRYAGTRAEAEDIMQEGFIKVFGCLHQFRYQGSFEGWIRTIMINSALKKYRQKKLSRSILPVDGIYGLNIAARESILPGVDAKDLLNLVQQLPPAYRMVFNLYVFEGMKHREIARALHISEGSSKSNLHDARVILQKHLIAELEMAAS
jgi:RNA polymerase sigma factor (sigma-70 family)